MEATPAEHGCSNCERLEREVAALRRENAALKARVATLERLLEEARRRGKRQAAPFSKGTPKKTPKRPGRKPGRDYAGILTHDGWSVYDRFGQARTSSAWRTSCRRARELARSATRAAARFPRRVLDVFGRAFALRDQTVAFSAPP